jgi:hypothetical protein
LESWEYPYERLESCDSYLGKKPAGNEQQANKTTYEMELDMKRTYSKSFENVFNAMQCLCWTVLYYDFDFDKDKLIVFQRGLTKHDKIIDEKNKYLAVDKFLKEEHKLDCHKLAVAFPYISKMKMAEYDTRKVKGTKAALVACDNAIEVFLVIFFYELIKEWGYSREQVLECYEQMKENALLYRKGMTNEFVQQYFKDEIDLVITM